MNVQRISERYGWVPAWGAKYISNAVVHHSYNQRLCFWTDRINLLYVFCNFYKYMMGGVFGDLYMLHPLVGSMEHKTTVFLIYFLKLGEILI